MKEKINCKKILYAKNNGPEKARAGALPGRPTSDRATAVRRICSPSPRVLSLVSSASLCATAVWATAAAAALRQVPRP